MNGDTARAFLDELRQRKVQFTRELTEIEALEASVVGFLGSLGMDAASIPMDQRKPVITVPPDIAIQHAPTLESDAEASPQSKWRDIIGKIFCDHGSSMTVVQIRETIRELGLRDRTSDPSLYNSVYTTLSRNPDLFEKRGKLWWLIGNQPFSTDNDVLPIVTDPRTKPI
jgi:hypothetical protein